MSSLASRNSRWWWKIMCIGKCPRHGRDKHVASMFEEPDATKGTSATLGNSSDSHVLRSCIRNDSKIKHANPRSQRSTAAFQAKCVTKQHPLGSELCVTLHHGSSASI
mmetsp:Transcript_8484/g.53013  ORF Transcript_8484/g.53013 Transcript_8484/m.53013 type:complete len:108 (+) Transcript_8484:92-415(+)